ncbi:MAG: ROK family protein [Acidobacteriota bacterium]|nr:ROK family protein [Acidobacteriota bacterium]
MKDKEPLILGVDVGGTKIATGVVAATNTIVTKTLSPTPPDDDLNVVMQQIYESIERTLSQGSITLDQIAGIGVVAPGPLDPQHGVIFHAPNIPAFKNVPLLELVQARFGKPTLVDNDANAAGLAEALFGAGVGYDHVLYVTVSTGIGTGLIHRQRIYHGKNGSAGEGGHVTIDHQGRLCGCGRRGCIEAYASGTALTKRAVERITTSATPSKILDLVDGDVSRINPIVIAQATQQGDALAGQLIEETGLYLSIWLGGMLNLLDPDVVIIGGGVSAIGDLLFDTIRAHLPSYTLNPFVANTPIVGAHFKEDVGILGAAALHLRQYSSPRGASR